MKRLILITVMILMCLPKAEACVGKVLYIGAVSSAEGQVLSEILATIINERTGTTVNTRYYKDSQGLYDAVKARQVDMIIENTTRAMHILSKTVDTDLKRTYESVKSAYEKEKGLIWFKPFGFSNGKDTEDQSYTAPLLRIDVVNNFPALPRLIGKLGGTVNNETYTKLMKLVESGEKPKKVARDFLRSKKLI